MLFVFVWSLVQNNPKKMKRLVPEDVPGAILKDPVLINNSVVDLKRWLLCRGLPSVGNKVELITRIEKCNENGLSSNIQPGVDKGIWYDLKFPHDTPSHSLPTAGWKTFPATEIPSLFSLGEIQNFLDKRNVELSTAASSGSEKEDDRSNSIVQGQKSWRRGRISYASGHVQLLEDNHTDTLYFLRAKVNASYKDTIHKVSITLDSGSSVIIDASCTCKAAACKSCSHVVGLLFALEDYTTLYGFGATTCTSKLNTWNVGRKRGKNPKRIFDATYPHHAKNEPNRKRFFEMSFDNGAASSCIESQEDFLKNLQMLSRPSMFQHILQFHYSDYSLSSDETRLLRLKVDSMLRGLVPKTMGPFDLSIKQNCLRWLQERRIRITASAAKQFFTAKKLDNVVNEHLWKNKNLENITAIRYGRDNESNAFNAYKSLTGFSVCKAGFIVNNKFPGLGCSPDGLVYSDKDGSITKLIEIKCPFKLKDIHPNALATIDGKNMCYTVDENSNLRVKRNHQYYFQVQLSLAIMNLQSCDFIIWSAKGMVIENIKRDEELISALTTKLIMIHRNILLPEFYEMRLPRKLPLLSHTQ